MASETYKEFYKNLKPFVADTKNPACDNTGYLIGFATEYYTLYKIHQVGCKMIFNYIKNITKDRAYVEDLPLSIDESLHGEKRHHFYRYIKIFEPNKFNFGKHKGEAIDTFEDGSYLMWYAKTDDIENRERCIERVKTLLPYMEWDAEKFDWTDKAQELRAKDLINSIKSGNPLTLDLNRLHYGCYIEHDGIQFNFPYAMYGGNYYCAPYALIINPKTGKGIRTKNKNYTVTIKGIDENIVENRVKVTEYQINK